MATAAFLSLVLIVLSAVTHYEILGMLNGSLSRLSIVPRRARVLLAILGAMGSHLIQITIFAVAYFLLRDRFGLGLFGGQFQDVFATFLYFSTETYTTLGLGDIYPTGELRMVTGIEALTGLLMISWTASFSYLEMNKYWKSRPG